MKKVNFNACTFLFLFFISRFLFAQTAKIDSLLSALKMAKNDTAEVNSLMAVSSGYNNLNRYDSALYYGNAALGLSEKSDFHKGIARAYNNLGVIFYSQENYDKALENYQVALNISLEAGDKITVSNSHNNIGNIYYMQGNYQKALENYFASLEISQELKEIKNASGTYSNIGAIYHEQGDYDKALENFFASLKLDELNGDKYGIVNNYNNIGDTYKELGNYDQALKNYYASLEITREIDDKEGMGITYDNIGNIYSAQGNYSKALENCFASLNIRKELDDKRGIAISYNNIGAIYARQGDYNKALENNLASLNIKEESGNKKGVAISLNNIGALYKLKKDYQKALDFLKKGLETGNEIGAKDTKLESYREISEVYALLSDHKKAFDYQQLYLQLKDSVFSEEMITKTTEMQTKYETEKKENEISLLRSETEKKELLVQKRNWQIAGIIFIGFALLVIGILFFNRYKTKQKQLKEIAVLETRQSERMRIARDMHDDIGAGLTRISLLSEQTKMELQKKNEQESVSENLNRLSSQSRELTRNLGEIIWTMNPKNDTLSGLFSYIRNFAFDFLENASMDCRISFPENIPELGVSPEMRRNVFLAVKESINNIVKHSQATKAEITLQLAESAFSLIIKDNGRGIGRNSKPGSGNGLLNIKKRIEELNGIYFIESSDQGVTITLKDIPFKNTTKV